MSTIALRRRMSNASTSTSRIKLLNKKQVADLLGVSVWTISDWIRKSKFPRPIYLSPGHPQKWREVDIEIWLQRQAKQVKPILRGAAKTCVGRPRQ